MTPTELELRDALADCRADNEELNGLVADLTNENLRLDDVLTNATEERDMLRARLREVEQAGQEFLNDLHDLVDPDAPVVMKFRGIVRYR